MTAVTAFERALELARTGRFAHVFAVRRRLVAEGYPSSELFGLSRRRMIAEAVRETHEEQQRGSRA